MATINNIPQIELSSGGKTMPVIGMGTATGRQESAKPGILEAIKAGYRHFDTAAIYGSEQALGEAIVEAVGLGLIKSRDQVFITSKLWCNSTERHLVLPAINKTLQNLGLEYIDLYLIHWPMLVKQEEFKDRPIPKECIFPIDIKSVWEAMEECQTLGLTKAIGVSNFSPKRLDHILSFAKIPPAVNQVEMNPVWQHKQLRDFCKEKCIHLSAYCPLGAVGSAWGDNRVMGCHVLEDIAKHKGKTVAQVSIRWLYEQGVSIIVKSFNKERMRENLDVFDWSLTEEELSNISRIPQRKGVLLTPSGLVEPNDVVAEIDAEI